MAECNLAVNTQMQGPSDERTPALPQRLDQSPLLFEERVDSGRLAVEVVDDRLLFITRGIGSGRLSRSPCWTLRSNVVCARVYRTYWSR